MIEQINNLLTLSDTPRYNIKAVVQQTQVNISTLRAWEQRYGVPHPQRSGHGHRLYSQRDIAIITWLRQCTENGLAISQAIAMLSDSDRADPESKVQVPSNPVVNDGWLAMRDQLLDALVSVNLRQAHLLVNTICTLFPIETVVLELFRPVLIEIGERWTQREICVADERFATNFIRQRLLSLIQLYAPFANGPRLICMCPPGEDHEIGLLTFALLMEQRGWEIIYLGQNVTVDGLLPFLQRQAPALVSLSISLVENVSGLLNVCRAIEPLQEQGMLLSYGGRVFDQYPEMQQRLPGLFLGNDLLEALNRADALGEQLERYSYHSIAAPAGRLAHLSHKAVGW
jgi:MerR family transcriptional regulator, light-induced transcriptional regulator